MIFYFNQLVVIKSRINKSRLINIMIHNHDYLIMSRAMEGVIVEDSENNPRPPLLLYYFGPAEGGGGRLYRI